ncbi:MAG: hypothetical protein JSS29_08600 [Proteobacteria bacterium]|nr:hypothetical protein [Pseudomonadota bacterium]
MSPRGDFRGIVHDVLEKLGKKRRVIFSTVHFSAIPVILKRIPAIATLPEHSARRFAADYQLETADPPLPLLPYESALAWLAKHDDDSVHRWVRQFVRVTIERLTVAGGKGNTRRAPRSRTSDPES